MENVGANVAGRAVSYDVWFVILTVGMMCQVQGFSTGYAATVFSPNPRSRGKRKTALVCWGNVVFQTCFVRKQEERDEKQNATWSLMGNTEFKSFMSGAEVNIYLGIYAKTSIMCSPFSRRGI